MGILLALLEDNSSTTSLISSCEESARKILDSTEFFIFSVYLGRGSMRSQFYDSLSFDAM